MCTNACVFRGITLYLQLMGFRPHTPPGRLGYSTPRPLLFHYTPSQCILDKKPEQRNGDRWSIDHIQGGSAKVRPTYIFHGNIWMHRENSINFGKCDNSNSGTHLGNHKSLIFNIVRQMATPRLGNFDLVTILILLTRTYSHRPIISRFQKVNKICLLYTSPSPRD